MNLRKAALLAAYLVFPLSTLVFLVAYIKPYPVWETWTFIDVWAQFARGEGWLRSLFVTRWGHIHALPNFITLLVGSVSCHSQMPEAIASWAMALAALFVIARQLPPQVLIALGVSSALFTVRLAEVWLNSWNLMWSLSLMQAALIGTCLTRPSWRSLGLAAGIGATSILTAGQGVAIVAAGTVPLLMHALRDRRAVPLVLVWVAFVIGCVVSFALLSGSGARAGAAQLISFDAKNVLALLAYALGEGESYLLAFVIVASLCIGYALRGFSLSQLTKADLFWVYMGSLLLCFVLLLTLTRPGHLLARYLTLLWIAPTVVVYFMYRSSEGKPAARAVVLAVCVGWVALNGWNGYAFGLLVDGWEPLSRDLVALSKSDPLRVQAEMLKGVSSNDVPLMARGLTTMRELSVNIYCAR
ncbi:MAG: hypothetical protein H7Z19_23000 [Chitinophagaceae bacterium]|nr:hypothetical protein [Rubrivivax sp.]